MAVANAGGATRIPREAERWGVVVEKGFGRVGEGFSWRGEGE